MKKLLSILLAFALILGVSATAFTVFGAGAENGIRIFAYRADGGCDEAVDVMPAGISVDSGPDLMYNGQRYVAVTISPLFAERYKAVYLEAPAGVELVQVYVNGSVNRSAVKMTRGGKTMRSALAANVDLRILPATADAELYLTGSYSGDALDAPLSLFSYKAQARVCSDKEAGRRLTLRTYIDMRSCKSAAGKGTQRGLSRRAAR